LIFAGSLLYAIVKVKKITWFFKQRKCGLTASKLAKAIIWRYNDPANQVELF